MTNQNDETPVSTFEADFEANPMPLVMEKVEATGFMAFPVGSELQRAIKELGYTEPTEIQAKTIPHLLSEDGDLIALASTGSGKTAAFGIPLIEQIDANENKTQGLVLCPTRELALQVSDQLQKLARFKRLSIATIFGGGSYTPQEKALRKGPQIIVATPGRLIDFIDQGLIDLKQVEILILDEADEMISLGFKEALTTILSETNEEAKKWMFSATMDRSIRSIADQYLNAPFEISQNKSAGLSETIEQVYMTVKRDDRSEALLRIIETHPEFYGIVFCQTKLEVAELTDRLLLNGIKVGCIHGDLKQGERTLILKKFRDKEIKALIATDVAARGIDVKDLTHVVNHSLPWDVESYIHRIGRTARNGKKGTAISMISPEQVRLMARIIQTTKRPVARIPIPKIDDVKEIYIKRMLPGFIKGTTHKGAEGVKTLVRKVAFEMELDLDALSAEDLLVNILAQAMGERFTGQKDDLDYLPADKVPRELSGDGRGGGGGFRRDSDRRFEGGSRGGRGGGGRFRGGNDDRRSAGPARDRSGDRFERGGEDRPPRRSSGTAGSSERREMRSRDESAPSRRTEGARREGSSSRFSDRPARSERSGGGSFRSQTKTRKKH